MAANDEYIKRLRSIRDRAQDDVDRYAKILRESPNHLTASTGIGKAEEALEQADRQLNATITRENANRRG